jgi:pyruvate kinase
MITQEHDTQNSLDPAHIEQVRNELTAIRNEMIAEDGKSQHRLEKVHPTFRESARNLIHYLTLRRRDLRPLQMRLVAMGLSSLGRSESHVLSSIDSILALLNRVSANDGMSNSIESSGDDFATGNRRLAEHAEALLGTAKSGRNVRIMVTMPGEAAHDFNLIDTLVREGLDCMRINCAHDEPADWNRMIENLRIAEESNGRKCKVVMDLAGPKLRTGPLEPGPRVIKIRPKRDDFGRVIAPARVWFTSITEPHPAPTKADGSLTVLDDWLKAIQRGDSITFQDSRGSNRRFVVVDVTSEGCWAELNKSAYITPETIFRREKNDTEAIRKVQVEGIQPKENFIPLKEGDLLVVTKDLQPGRPATYDEEGKLLGLAKIGCSIPSIFDDIKEGESIWFDDGKIGGVIQKIESSQMTVQITKSRPGGDKLRSDKGINLPETNLRLPALTEKDLEDLEFVAQHADVIELSFANTAEDVEQLQQNLARWKENCPAIVLKIETRRGFDNLPEMLLMAMRSPCCGVMIARGDLAVECGFERMAEIQEEILWISEAAHVPVIWATQVLESLAKEGMPSRAEITDAAMGDRAECVMLNKGPHVVSAVRVLDDILTRMQAHQAKKRSMLRELRLAHTLKDI